MTTDGLHLHSRGEEAEEEEVKNETQEEEKMQLFQF